MANEQSFGSLKIEREGAKEYVKLSDQEKREDGASRRSIGLAPFFG